MPRVLMHVCCGPCAAGCIGRLAEEGMDVTLYFCNPNLATEEEYAKRLGSALVLAKEAGVPIVSERYAGHDKWLLDAAKGHEDDKEGGERCRRCFRHNLEKTREFASREGFDCFTTSLTVSPHKKSSVIFAEGKAAGGDAFLPIDFKKKGGFLKSLEISSRLGLYRQDYCGCEFSLRDRNLRKRDEDGARGD